MKLSELLDELRDGILHDVSNQIAGASDYLWTDARLVRYINEAQRRFARLSLTIRDATTPEVCNVVLRAGQSQYDLHPSVLAVISARKDGDNADLVRAGHTVFDTYRTPDPLYFDPSSLAAVPPGKPIAYSTDEALLVDDDGQNSTMSMRIYPAPSTTYDKQVVRLRVIRLPLNDLIPQRMNAVPEVPTSFHLDMLDWAAYLALRKVDTDAGNPDMAAAFKKSFGEHVASAKREMMRKLFAPMQFGFGRGGWSWER